MNPFFLVAALADLTAVAVHGFVGHRLFLTPLTTERLFPTGAFGSAETSRRVFIVTWHAVTAAFACSAGLMALAAFGAVTSTSGPLFASAMHASFAVVALAVSWRRLGHMLRRPISLTFAAVMTAVSLMGWLGTR